MKKVRLTEVIFRHVYVFGKRKLPILVPSWQHLQRVEVVSHYVFLGTNIDLLRVVVREQFRVQLFLGPVKFPIFN